MKVRVWGCRGSLPAPGPSTVRYGGNTSCVEVRLDDGGLIIVDAGTGIRALGCALGPCEATLLVSHYHWDHIQGLPFFAPAFDPHNLITLHGPIADGAGPQQLLGMQMSPPYFPAAPSQMCGIRSWLPVSDQPIAVGNATIRAVRLSHPGVTFGYRIQDDNVSVMYMSDNEPALASPELMARMVELASGADLLIHDCQYTEAEYAHRRGWGHATPGQVADFARHTRVHRLMLFHHDPGHSDAQVEDMAEEVRDLIGEIDVVIGAEGCELDVAGPLQIAPQQA